MRSSLTRRLMRSPVGTAFLLCAATSLARCSCEEGGVQQALVEMDLTLIEIDPCSGAAVPRRVPDDYTAANLPLASDLGSRAEKVFEVRSRGSAALRVSAPGMFSAVRSNRATKSGVTCAAKSTLLVCLLFILAPILLFCPCTAILRHSKGFVNTQSCPIWHCGNH